MGKELDGLSCSKCCSQWLDVHMKTSGLSQGPVWGLST